MRVKVESAPPLPSVKAWLSLAALSTVSDLKTLICYSLQPFSDAGIHERDIHLVLDGFELLDSSEIDILRDGDLVTYFRLLVCICIPNNDPIYRIKPTSLGMGPRKRKAFVEGAYPYFLLELIFAHTRV